MPIRIWIDKEAALARAEVWGSVTTEEIIAAVDSVMQDPDFHSGLNGLSDHRQVDQILTPEQMHRLLNHLTTFRDRLANRRWAVVTGSQAAYGMIRMTSAHATRIPLDIRPFKTLEEAREWLSTDESVKRDAG
jgi:hypothetical protein